MKAELTIESFVEQAGRDGLVEGGQGSSCNIHAFLSFLLRVGLKWRRYLAYIAAYVVAALALAASIAAQVGR